MSRTYGLDDPGNAFRRTDAPAAKQGGLFETDSDDGQNTFTDGQGNKYWFVDTTAGDVTVTLPNAAEVTPDTIFTVKRVTAGANNLYVTTGGGLVDGQVSQNIISQYACYSYISDGENYWVSGVGSGEGSVSISAMITARLATYITSASVATALGGYVTSSSLNTALATYLSSNSFSAAIANYATSNSVSIMIGARLTSYITSASVATALAAYVTSSSLATALGTYLTSNSASIALATKQPKFSVADEGVTLSTVAGTVTTINFVGAGISASLTGGILTVTGSGGSGSGEGSVSVSSMITTALAGYITSASVATALGAYVTSGSLVTALGTYVTSSSLATALATYATSASVVTALAVKQPNFNVQDEGVTLTTAAGTVTQINFVGTGISASLTGGILTVTAVAGAGSGEGSVSISDMITTRLATAPGMVLLGSLSVSVGLGGVFGFSGSWSDYAMLELRATYRPNGTSLTASAAIYTDGGTTPMLPITVGTVSAAAFYHVTLRAYLGGGFKALQMENATAAARTQQHTATSNTGFVNCIRLQHGTAASATISVGLVQLFGLRR